MKYRVYRIRVHRVYTEVMEEEVEVRATDEDSAKCKASDELTDLIGDGKIDASTSEHDDYEVLSVE